MIDSLSEERAKKILKSVADKMPSIILDVAEQLSKPTAAEAEPTQQPPAEPGPSAPGPDHQTWPSWCVCRRCREMPSDASRVCCGMRPDLCTSLQPVSRILTQSWVLLGWPCSEKCLFTMSPLTKECAPSTGCLLRNCLFRQSYKLLRKKWPS